MVGNWVGERVAKLGNKVAELGDGAADLGDRVADLGDRAAKWVNGEAGLGKDKGDGLSERKGQQTE